MISERRLASSHASFWRLIMPMGEAFVRSMNAELRSFSMKLPTAFPPARQSLLSELAFRVFCGLNSSSITPNAFKACAEEVGKLAERTRGYISLLEHGMQIEELSLEEQEEAYNLAIRIQRYFVHHEGRELVFACPQFPGCGIVDDCEGDVLVGTTLYEIKNVDRDFRLVDIRQLLAYTALNFASKRHRIEAVALLNARSGCYYRCRLDSLALGVAGSSSYELHAAIVSYISRDLPSQ